MGVNSLPKTVTRQRRNCDLNPDPSAPESSTLTTRLPIHPAKYRQKCKKKLSQPCAVVVGVYPRTSDLNMTRPAAAVDRRDRQTPYALSPLVVGSVSYRFGPPADHVRVMNDFIVLYCNVLSCNNMSGNSSGHE